MIKQPEDAREQLYAAIGDTELLALDIAHKCLELAEVEVDIIGCDYPFLNALPDDLQVLFASKDLPAPERVTNMDLRLNYYPASWLYRMTALKLQLDNNFSFSFARTSQYILGGNPDERLYYAQIITPHGAELLDDDKTPLVPERTMNELFTQLNIAIPTAPQRAGWEAIASTLQFSNLWHATASSTIPLDMTHQLYVEERMDGRGHTGDEEIDDNPGSHITEISVGIEESPDIAQTPDTILKFRLLSDDEEDQPRFAGLQRMPVVYEPMFLGHDELTRKEIGDQAQLLPITLGTVQHIANAIRQALA